MEQNLVSQEIRSLGNFVATTESSQKISLRGSSTWHKIPSPRQNFLATEFPVTPVRNKLGSRP